MKAVILTTGGSVYLKEPKKDIAKKSLHGVSTNVKDGSQKLPLQKRPKLNLDETVEKFIPKGIVQN